MVVPRASTSMPTGLPCTQPHNAPQVQFKDGAIRTCLAPFLGLMNHHALPHVVHFSKVDPASGCIRWVRQV